MQHGIKVIGVVGAGTMGSGIAQVGAQSGHEVILYDISDEIIQGAISRIAGFVRRAAEKGRLDPEAAEAALTRLHPATDLAAMADAHVVIEAAPEILELKHQVFERLDAVCPPETILATNTSTLSVTRIAAATTRAEKVVGMHFFNPPPLMPLVEVAASSQTAEATVAATVALAEAMGKVPVRTKDVPGFIVNRVARPFYLEGLRLLGEGVADHATIDRLIREGGNFPMGPFELMDLIGIDINFAASQSVYEAFFGEPRFRPHPLQRRQVESGNLGRKTGRGWYEYEDH
ncbi:MAG: 3-hydroxyacyl-CoA dehydrogenase NAD-binding domain-containing protein [Ardenticatenaceae bacterium]|nr:3-hydroxyacyl-CoA dehydrogenase NAD-binding domain-containing protein [Ardenticatenaceae bacterium]HBY98790.1 3-hydroxybutyryl-CoA dehydrogenase [Chloroflexota bacterium]